MEVWDVSISFKQAMDHQAAQQVSACYGQRGVASQYGPRQGLAVLGVSGLHDVTITDVIRSLTRRRSS